MCLRSGYVANMAAVGASGYVVKQNSGQALVHAVKEIASGRAYFSPSILKRMEEAARRTREFGGANAKPTRPLTSREAEVLQLVAEGAANKQIAAELGISIKIVEKHRQQERSTVNRACPEYRQRTVIDRQNPASAPSCPIPSFPRDSAA